MSKVRLNGSTSGYVELTAPAVAGTNSLTLPSGNGAANQLLKNGATPGTLGWSSMTEDASGNLATPGGITTSGDINAGGSGTPARLRASQSDPEAAQVLYVDNTGSSFSTRVASFNATRNTSNASYSFLVCSVTGVSQRLIIRDSGNVLNANNSYGAISDAKLKENIEDAGSQWSDFRSLRVRNYNFKQETGQPTHRQIGLIAQEAETVCPGLVSTAPDRDEEGNELGTVTKSINYSVLYMKAVKALQEAMERIETLESRLAALEANQ